MGSCSCGVALREQQGKREEGRARQDTTGTGTGTGTDTGTDTDRQTERQRDRETERQAHTHAHTRLPPRRLHQDQKRTRKMMQDTTNRG